MKQSFAVALVMIMLTAMCWAEPPGGAIPCHQAAPMTIVQQRQPPCAVPGPMHTMPPLTLFSAKVAPTVWTQVPPPPPIKLFRPPPPPIKAFAAAPPQVSLFRLTPAPPVWKTAPPPPPIKLFEVQPQPARYVSNIVLPAIKVYHQPQPPPAHDLGCLTGP